MIAASRKNGQLAFGRAEYLTAVLMVVDALTPFRLKMLGSFDQEVEDRNGEMARGLRALTVLPEVLCSVPSNHMGAHNHL